MIIYYIAKRKHFCRHCLQAFRTEGVLKFDINECFKINGQQRIKMPKKGEYVRFKNFEKNEVTIYDLCKF